MKFISEKQFLQWLLELINYSNTITDVQSRLCATDACDFDTKTTSIGTFIGISTVINGKPYVYSFFFENENDVKYDTFQLKQLINDIAQYD